MNDVDRLILEAWQKLGPKIMADPDELNKRLARRRSALLTRPPRAWCLAVRASDRRITPAHWIITPEHAMDLNHPDHPYEPIEHEVTIQPHALRKYCRPVRTDSLGELVQDVAKQLGVNPISGLNNARWASIFTERFVKGLGGKHGKPIPLIHSWNTLDPSGHGHFARPDPLWGSLWEFFPDMIPDDFEQTVLRRPKFGRWMGRSGSQARAPEDHFYKDEVRFKGWQWVCPGCKKEVSKIYYPLPQRTLFDFLGYDPGVCHGRVGRAPAKFLRYDLHKVEPPPPTFACFNCHQIRGFTRTTSTGWNEVVSCLTRGMLYGHEVPKPQWYRPQRKKARFRKLGPPAEKRQAVLRRLSNGWTVQEIAREMLISIDCVRTTLRVIFKQERVKNRHELAAKLHWKHPQPISKYEKRMKLARERDSLIEPMLLLGLSYREISQRLGMNHRTLHAAAIRIYRKHGVEKREGRKALAKKLGEVGKSEFRNPKLESMTKAE